MFLLYENKDRPWNPVNQGNPPHSTSCPHTGANPEGFKGGRHFIPSLKRNERGDSLTMETMFPNYRRAGQTTQRRKQKSSVPGQQRDSLPDLGNPTTSQWDHQITRSLLDSNPGLTETLEPLSPFFPSSGGALLPLWLENSEPTALYSAALSNHLILIPRSKSAWAFSLSHKLLEDKEVSCLLLMSFSFLDTWYM